jgi:hypothetical protein
MTAEYLKVDKLDPEVHISWSLPQSCIEVWSVADIKLSIMRE